MYKLKSDKANSKDLNITYIELHNKIWTSQAEIEKELLSLQSSNNYEIIVDLNREIKLVKHEILRSSCELEETFLEWLENQKIIEYNHSSGLSTIKHNIRIFVKTWILRFLALQAIIMSLATILSEITLYTKINFSLFGMFMDVSDSLFIVHLLTIVPSIFIFISCLFGLFNLRISGVYGMYKNNHTDSTSLLFLSGFMCRVGIPMCINFVQILKLKKKTILEDIVGSTELDPFFGTKILYIYPVALLVLLLLNSFNIYGYIIRMLGISSYNFKSSYSEDKILDGLMILKKMKMDRNMVYNKISKNSYDYITLDNNSNIKDDNDSVLNVDNTSDE